MPQQQPQYVNSGAENRTTVSSGGVSGLTVTMPALVPGNFLLATILMRPSGTVPTAGFNDDTLSVTGSGVWSVLTDQALGQVFGGHIALYGKHCTGGEGDLKALMTAVGLGGNCAAYGAMHQFSNVKNPGDTSYFELLSVTGRGSVSGVHYAPNVAAVGGSRLNVNIVGCVNGSGVLVSALPTGETAGKWTRRNYTTGVAPRFAMWTSTDQTVQGGTASAGTGPAGNNPMTIISFALAPCSTVVPEMHHYLLLSSNS